MKELTKEELDRLKSEAASCRLTERTVRPVDLVQFVFQEPGLEGFRSHRPIIGPILTHLRFRLFRIMSWLSPPVQHSLMAQAYAIEALKNEVAALKAQIHEFTKP